MSHKLIEGQRYKIAVPTKINDDPNVCFLIDGKYYRLAKGAIIYDYFKKRYVLKSSIQIENGFVGINEDDTPILGNWSLPDNFSEEDTILAIYKKQEFVCINADIFKNTGWEERLSDTKFYLKSSLPVKEFSKINIVDRDIKNSYHYNASDTLKPAIKKYKERFKVLSYNQGIKNYPQVLGKYTYGYEFETTKGIIPQRICNTLGLIPLRDGSIQGIEYATIPLSGKEGLQTIIETCEELENRTTFDHDCSLHIHIGGMPRKESYFIALTKVLCAIQEEMYKSFPFYTKGGYGLKKKDYTAPLPALELMSQIDNKIDIKDKKQLNANFQHVFGFLSMGHNYSDYDYDLKNVKSHPSDPQGTSKWYVKSRYRWVNMIPLLFGNKKTIEFRIHTPTYDPNKIIYFSVLCAAIVDFAERNCESILNGTINLGQITFENLTYSYLSQFGDKYGKYHSYLMDYFRIRARDQRSFIVKGELMGDENKILVGRNNFYSENDLKFKLEAKEIKRILGEITEELEAREPLTFRHAVSANTRSPYPNQVFRNANGDRLR